MTKAELLAILTRQANEFYDSDKAHRCADLALLDYINDPEVSAIFHAIDKWYS